MVLWGALRGDAPCQVSTLRAVYMLCVLAEAISHVCKTPSAAKRVFTYKTIMNRMNDVLIRTMTDYIPGYSYVDLPPSGKLVAPPLPSSKSWFDVHTVINKAGQRVTEPDAACAIPPHEQAFKFAWRRFACNAFEHLITMLPEAESHATQDLVAVRRLFLAHVSELTSALALAVDPQARNAGTSMLRCNPPLLHFCVLCFPCWRSVWVAVCASAPPVLQ